jgi:hypothetical protein
MADDVVPDKQTDSGTSPWLTLSADERDACKPLDDLGLTVSDALHRGDLALVAQYLREIVAPLVRDRIPRRVCSTAAIELLADMLQRREGIPWHLKRVPSRRGKPSDVARTTVKNIAIGRRIAEHPLSGEFTGPLQPSDPRPALKAAVADICAELNIKPAHAYKCLRLYKENRFANKHYESLPLSPDPARRRSR